MLERHLRVIASRSAAEGEAAERGTGDPRSAPDLTAVRALAGSGELAAAVAGPPAGRHSQRRDRPPRRSRTR